MIWIKYKFKVCSYTVNTSKQSTYQARAGCESFTRVRHFGISNLVIMLRKVSGMVCFVCLCAYPSGLVGCGLFVVPVVIVVISNSMSVGNV